MDDTDRKLMMLIVENPRIHFEDLAKKLGISKQAAYRRLQALIGSGVIGQMTADISVSYLGAVPVAVFGRSCAQSVLRVLDRLGECESTRRVIAGCGNYIYVNGILRDKSELEEFSEFVIREAALQDVGVGIYSPDPGMMRNYVVDGIADPKPVRRELSNLDLRIIASLKDDVRRPVQDIARSLGVTAKTVKRHLETMIADGSLELHVRSDQPLAGDLLFVVHVSIREGADSGEVGRMLLSKYPFKDAFLLAYSNIPNLLFWIFWTGEVAEMRKILGAVDEDGDIVAVMPNFAYLMRIYSTWQDKLLRELIEAAERAGDAGDRAKAVR